MAVIKRRQFNISLPTRQSTEQGKRVTCGHREVKKDDKKAAAQTPSSIPNENAAASPSPIIIPSPHCPSPPSPAPSPTEKKLLALLPGSSLTPLITFPPPFLVGVPLVGLPTRPPRVLSFLGVVVVVVVLGFLGVAAGRAPESTSDLRTAASFLMMRKRPSIES